MSKYGVFGKRHEKIIFSNNAFFYSLAANYECMRMSRLVSAERNKTSLDGGVRIKLRWLNDRDVIPITAPQIA